MTINNNKINHNNNINNNNDNNNNNNNKILIKCKKTVINNKNAKNTIKYAIKYV